MREVEAKHFDVPGIALDDTPISVRKLPKEPGTHRSPVPSDEWSIHVSSGWNIPLEEWHALAKACADAGWSVDISANENGIAIW